MVDGRAKTVIDFVPKDDLHDWTWKGPENVELDELIPLKNEYEIKEGIEMSKEGIVNFIESMV